MCPGPRVNAGCPCQALFILQDFVRLHPGGCVSWMPVASCEEGGRSRRRIHSHSHHLCWAQSASPTSPGWCSLSPPLPRCLANVGCIESPRHLEQSCGWTIIGGSLVTLKLLCYKRFLIVYVVFLLFYTHTNTCTHLETHTELRHGEPSFHHLR